MNHKKRRTNKFKKELSKNRSGKFTEENNANSKLSNVQRSEIKELYFKNSKKI